MKTIFIQKKVLMLQRTKISSAIKCKLKITIFKKRIGILINQMIKKIKDLINLIISYLKRLS